MTIKLDAKNSRKHSDRNKSAIRKSLETVGAFRSVGMDADEIMRVGNGVYTEAQALGIPVRIVESDGTELIVVKRTDLQGEKAVQAATLDNLTADTSAFDYDADRLRDALANDPVSKAIAEQDERLRALLQKPPKAETADAGELVDRAELLQQKWNCVSGDIWTAAGHFWICGDCRDFETWRKLLEAAKVERVNGVFTSPPYAEQRKAQYGGVPTDQYVEWWNEVQANVRANLANDGSFFVNIKPHCENGERVLYVFDLVLAMKRQWGWRFVDELCWVDVPIPGKWENRFKNGFEPVYHFCAEAAIKFRPLQVSEFGKTFKADGKTHFSGNGAIKGAIEVDGYIRPSNIIRTGTSDGVHEASFPVALPEFFVKAYSDSGDSWLDPFLGSGTTIIAAHRNGRRGLGIEKLEKYCAVICERIEKETGETPHRLASAAQSE